MSDCTEPCDGCANRATHHLCDKCCEEDVNALNAKIAKLHEHLADVVRKCQYGCDRKIYCRVCKTAIDGLPEGYEL